MISYNSLVPASHYQKPLVSSAATALSAHWLVINTAKPGPASKRQDMRASEFACDEHLQFSVDEA